MDGMALIAASRLEPPPLPAAHRRSGGGRFLRAGHSVAGQRWDHSRPWPNGQREEQSVGPAGPVGVPQSKAAAPAGHTPAPASPLPAAAPRTPAAERRRPPRPNTVDSRGRSRGDRRGLPPQRRRRSARPPERRTPAERARPARRQPVFGTWSVLLGKKAGDRDRSPRGPDDRALLHHSTLPPCGSWINRWRVRSPPHNPAHAGTNLTNASVPRRTAGTLAPAFKSIQRGRAIPIRHVVLATA